MELDRQQYAEAFEMDANGDPIAGTIRCISCGHAAPPSGPAGIPTGALNPAYPHGRPHSYPNHARGGSMVDGGMDGSAGNARMSVIMDDELSTGSNDANRSPHHSQHVPDPVVLAGNEEMVALLSGNVGLKPLLQQHKPHPVKGTNGGKHSTSMASNSRGSSASGLRTEKIPEPLYRKARMASHIKEMVKVSSGYGGGSNGANGANSYDVTSGVGGRSQSRGGTARPHTVGGVGSTGGSFDHPHGLAGGGSIGTLGSASASQLPNGGGKGALRGGGGGQNHTQPATNGSGGGGNNNEASGAGEDVAVVFPAIPGAQANETGGGTGALGGVTVSSAKLNTVD